MSEGASTYARGAAAVAEATVGEESASPAWRRDLRVVLIQIRGQPKAQRHEVWCMRQCTGLDKSQLLSWNVVERPEVRWAQLRGADALVIGGSGDHSVTCRYPFMPWLEDTVRSAVDAGQPVFGICWGHHILAKALGGRVITDPASEEVGTFEVELTAEGAADPLFTGTPRQFPANLVHHDCVETAPEGFQELARSALCRYQAMRLPAKPVYGTQFHGEMTISQLRRRLLMYQDEYLESEEQVRGVVESFRDTDEARRLLRRFLELYT